MLFKTKRLGCRRWKPQDIDTLFSIYSDAETVRWCGDGSPITQAQCQDWLRVTERNYAERGYGMFAFVESDSNQVVGFGGLVHPGGQAEAEVKYAFDRSRWGQGLASEAIPPLLAYGASAHGLDRVIATVAAANKRSQRVLIKAGMQFEASRVEDDGSATLIYGWKASTTARPRTSS